MTSAAVECPVKQQQIVAPSEMFNIYSMCIHTYLNSSSFLIYYYLLLAELDLQLSHHTPYTVGSVGLACTQYTMYHSAIQLNMAMH
jgi:hypothetical protein